MCIIDNVLLDSGAVRPRGLLLHHEILVDVMTYFSRYDMIFVFMMYYSTS